MDESHALPPLLSGVANLCGMIIGELLIAMGCPQALYKVLNHLRLSAQATLWASQKRSN